MLKFITRKDKHSHEEWIETDLTGKALLLTSLLNKGTAFTESERRELNILGKLPYQIETLEEQLVRAKHQFDDYTTPLQQYTYLNNLHDKNEILFYKLLIDNLEQMIPLIYTPGVSDAVKSFSRAFRQPRGLYLTYPDKDHIDAVLDNRTHANIDIILVTDGERVLGIGDQGIGGMDIAISKLVVYTLGGVNPYRTLPIVIDVGTDNPELLQNPQYLGWRHPRLRGQEYDTFIDDFVQKIHQKFPHALLHWEDFAQQNARRFLEKYRLMHCSFNDDMQGTAVITLAAILSGIRATKTQLADQRIVILGAGTAGVGIADQLYRTFCDAGIDPTAARRQFWFIDRQGLLIAGDPGLAEFQKPYARPVEEKAALYAHQQVDLEAVVAQVKPTVLIGCSTVKGAFTEKIIKSMAAHVARPIIFPLSNPPEKAEATPEDLIHWTAGKALVATGSPYPEVIYNGKTIKIAQCNNALAFPGIGLGVIATKATCVTDAMLDAATQTIVSHSPVLADPLQPLLPRMSEIPTLAFQVACAVGQQAIKDKIGVLPEGESMAELIGRTLWKPYYRPIRLKKDDL